MLSADVLVAMTARAGARRSMSARSASLTSIRSGTASMMKSRPRALQADPWSVQPAPHRIAVRRRRLPSSTPSRESIESTRRPCRSPPGDIVESRVVSGRDRRVRDPVAHRPRAENRQSPGTGDGSAMRRGQLADDVVERSRSRDRFRPRCCRNAAPCGCPRPDDNRRSHSRRISSSATLRRRARR